MRIIVFILMMLASSVTFAQQQELEDIAEQQETDIEDDDLIQPVDLNTATEADLQDLQLLNALQVKAFVQYRELLGKLLSIYELQAIPYWDIATIQKILPYVTIGEQTPKLMKGSGTLLARFSRKVLLRYKYTYKNLLQYGVLVNKDGSETNYSFHVFVRNLGMIQSLAIGDFTVNMGQGLIHWQTLALGKSAEITGAKRQSAILRLYSSPGKDNFHRGVAVSLKRHQLTATTFASFKDQLTLGGTLAFDHKLWHVAANLIHYNFPTPVEKRDEPYDLFAFRGTQLTNYSINYDYTFHNLHGFGEVAASSTSGFAMVHGLLVSLDRRADASLVVRHLTPAFQSLYS
ncbi:MAG TPA: helix-hairpin-helix domain-containing protein, partial [Chitinophagaceae bacterium]|nr:helix-hairpin-helix domain-containing protein [Chitinophagaceae bacterium]